MLKIRIHNPKCLTEIEWDSNGEEFESFTNEIANDVESELEEHVGDIVSAENELLELEKGDNGEEDQNRYKALSRSGY